MYTTPTLRIADLNKYFLTLGKPAVPTCAKEAITIAELVEVYPEPINENEVLSNVVSTFNLS
jgi:hypothetical protein